MSGAASSRLARAHGPRPALAAASLPLALLAGCPPGLEQPERFSRECTTGEVVEALFRSRCAGSGCHGRTEHPGAGLDLVSPGVFERLAAVPARECEGELLVHPTVPARSYLFAKVAGEPRCGDPMPIGGRRLSPAEVSCVEAWVRARLQASDAGLDVSRPDAALDARADAPTDAAGTDAPADGPGTDAPADALSEAPTDAARDSITDAEASARDGAQSG